MPWHEISKAVWPADVLLFIAVSIVAVELRMPLAT